jgi:hypothetical protein
MTLLDPKTEALALRAAIQAKLAEAQKEIARLQAAHDATAAAVSEAAINHQSMVRLLLKPFETQSGERFESAEPEVNLYLEDLRTKLDQAKSIRARALGDLESARINVERLNRSIAQIDRAIPIENEEAA